MRRLLLAGALVASALLVADSKSVEAQFVYVSGYSPFSVSVGRVAPVYYAQPAPVYYYRPAPVVSVYRAPVVSYYRPPVVSYPYRGAYLRPRPYVGVSVFRRW